MTIVIFAGIVWSIFSVDVALKSHLTFIGIAVILAIFMVLGVIQRPAKKAVNLVQEAFANDFQGKFNEPPGQALTGLSP